MKHFTKTLLLTALAGAQWATLQELRACNLSSFTLTSVVQNGGNWDITTTLCIGAGVTGFVQGADQPTGMMAAFFYGPAGTPVTVLAAGPAAITSTFRGCTMLSIPSGGPIDGCYSPDPCGPPYYNAIDDAVFLTPNFCSPCAAPCDLGFTCITSTALCGNVHQDCFTLTYTTDIKPDSIRMMGAEGAGQAFGGCYPNQDMLIDFTTAPVIFGDITAKSDNGVNLLDWFTTMENNNAGFEVLRSADGDAYAVVGKVESKGNGNGKHSYQFIDHSPLPNDNYYKIRQTDLDGRSMDSKVVEISYAAPTAFAWVSVGPVPSAGMVSLNFFSETSRSLAMTLSDMDGMVVLRQAVAAHTGLNSIAVDLGNQAKGVYFLHLADGETKLTHKLMKF